MATVQRKRRGTAVPVLAVCVLSAAMGTSAANVALPEVADAFGATFGQARWVVLAYLLAMTAVSVAVGHLGDVFGRRRVLAVGLPVFAAGAIAGALAPSLWVLVVARGVQGVGAAVMMALPPAMVRDAVPAERTGTVMGLLGTASAAGTALGPSLGGALIGLWDWTAVFWAMAAPVPLIALGLGGVPGAGAPRRNGHARGRVGGTGAAAPGDGPGAGAPRRGGGSPGRFDGVGAVVLTGVVVLYTLGVTDPGALGALPVLALLGGAAAGLVVFVLVERRSAHPLIPVGEPGSRVLLPGAALNLVVGAVMMGTLIVGPFYLAGALGLGPAAVGAVMAAGPVASLCTGVLAGRTVDRLGAARTTAAGLAVMAAAALALALLPGPWGLAGYLVGAVALAPGYQLFMAANNTRVMAAVTAGRRGAASGVLGLSRNLGLLTGTSALGALFAAAAGTADVATASPEALTGAVAVTFTIAACGLAAAALTAAVPRGATLRR
ncbi:MFS transporter [Nocardiopsis sp. CC223A]|uniref:MFS transporter n=1 Tax=Nocardiopsis sp. CC223A TaxID=3044051 RepID=UPI002795C9E3|nr:MFS transporter [Nocardiopsis sp. CC223A]